MASRELNVVLNALRSNPPMGDRSILELRADLEALTANAPLPKDVTYAAVEANGVAGEWATPESFVASHVILYFHGGGYALGSISTHRLLVGAIAKAAQSRVLSLDYRLGPEHPFPAAVEDAVAGYKFLLTEGFDPEQIALAGDSAGGGLTAACLLALRDHSDPLPAAGVCISPWLDLALTGKTLETLADLDPLVTQDGLTRMAAAYLGDTDPRTPLASPLFAELHDLPPLLIHVGTAETLLDDSIRFAKRAETAGVEVELDVWEEMIHVWHTFCSILPEAREAIERIAEFLSRRFAAAEAIQPLDH